MIKLIHGDCLDVIRTIEDCSIDSVVTDPPYGLQFMGREWDRLWRNKTAADEAYVEDTKGELTSRARKLPDYSASNSYQMQEWHLAWAREVFRVLKPGGYILAFSSPRTYHRLGCAIEDAGFEIRDQIMWVYGSGFPKNHDVSKGIDRMAGAKREVVGKALRDQPAKSQHHGGMQGAYQVGQERFQPDITAPATPSARQWEGWGTALKPSHEPICVARKPLSEPTIAANVLRWGTGAINVGGCRVATDELTPRNNNNTATLYEKGFEGKPLTINPSPLGRWPANFIHDGSDEVVGAFPETGTSSDHVRHNRQSDSIGTFRTVYRETQGISDSGSASRFFYSAKASRKERDDGLEGIRNGHPTVKPLKLMRYLCRLVTPPGGTVLDPFMGSGSTGCGAILEGFRFIGVELSEEYLAIARGRIKAAQNERNRRKQYDLFMTGAQP